MISRIEEHDSSIGSLHCLTGHDYHDYLHFRQLAQVGPS